MVVSVAILCAAASGCVQLMPGKLKTDECLQLKSNFEKGKPKEIVLVWAGLPLWRTRNGSSSSSRGWMGFTTPSTSALGAILSANWERCGPHRHTINTHQRHCSTKKMGHASQQAVFTYELQ